MSDVKLGIMSAEVRLRLFREKTWAAVKALPEAVFAQVAEACRNVPGSCFCGCHISRFDDWTTEREVDAMAKQLQSVMGSDSYNSLSQLTAKGWHVIAREALRLGAMLPQVVEVK